MTIDIWGDRVQVKYIQLCNINCDQMSLYYLNLPSGGCDVDSYDNVDCLARTLYDDISFSSDRRVQKLRDDARLLIEVATKFI